LLASPYHLDHGQPTLSHLNNPLPGRWHVACAKFNRDSRTVKPFAYNSTYKNVDIFMAFQIEEKRINT
jgi:hypothetical protein